MAVMLKVNNLNCIALKRRLQCVSIMRTYEVIQVKICTRTLCTPCIRSNVMMIVKDDFGTVIPASFEVLIQRFP
jgi:hypothetical protein